MKKWDDKWIRIGGILLLLFNLFIVDGKPMNRSFKDEFIYILLYLVFSALILESGRKVILFMHGRYPAFQQSGKRFRRTVLYAGMLNSFLIPLTYNIFHWLRGMHAGNTLPFFIWMSIGSFLLALVQTGIYESFYNFNRVQKLELEREELLRINLQSQFDSLKQQVNPHFLFNSINTVSSLISIDPDRAKKFLSEMSKVYRYLLRANEEELTTLEKELVFLHSYFHLLKTRFGNGLELKLSINDVCKQYSIPVLSLQLLIENAVKHNLVEPGQPLIIHVETISDHFLCVRNNLQKKQYIWESNKIGLSNIMMKYKLLKQEEPVVKETDKEFIVLLPLIKNKVYERIDH